MKNMNILVLRRDKNWFINTLFNNCFIFYYIEYTPKYTPILHKSKSFPCLAHAMPAFRRCKFCMCKFCRLGHCMGLMFQTGLSWGCFASAVWQGGFNRLHGAGLVSGSGRQTAGGWAACRDALPEKTKLGTAGGQGNRPCPIPTFRKPAALPC